MIEMSITDKIKLILKLQQNGASNEEIARDIGLPSHNALRSFMNRQGYKSTKSGFVMRDDNDINKTNNKKRDSIEAKLKGVLELQKQGFLSNEIAEKMNFSSTSALRSFMNREGYKSADGKFQPKEKAVKNNAIFIEEYSKIESNEQVKEVSINKQEKQEKEDKKRVTKKKKKDLLETDIASESNEQVKEISINKEEKQKKEKESLDVDNKLTGNEKVYTTPNEQSKRTDEESRKIAEKVVELQFYRIPYLEIAKFVDLQPFELDKLMLEQGYIAEAGKFIEKSKVEVVTTKPKKKAKATSKSKKKKNLKAEPTKEDIYKANLKKYGRFDMEMGVYIINPTFVTIMENQSKKISIDKTAKEVNMTVRTMHNFMKTQGYVWDNGKYVKESDLLKEEDTQTEIIEEIEEREPLVRPELTAEIDGPIYLTEYDIKAIDRMYDWIFKNKNNKFIKPWFLKEEEEKVAN